MPRTNETTLHPILTPGSDPELRRRFMIPGEPGTYIASCHFTMVARSGVGAQASRDHSAKDLFIPCFFKHRHYGQTAAEQWRTP